MPNIIDDLRRTYTVACSCNNCGYIFNISIPKGILMDNYFKSSGAACRNCGCESLKRYKPLFNNFDNNFPSFWDDTRKIKDDIENNCKGGDNNGNNERKKQRKDTNGHRRRRH